METFRRSAKPVMLLSGLLTCTMFYALVAPEASLQSTFGETLSGPVANIVVRNWGALIGLVGLGLIYGAVNEAARRPALLLAVTSKITFIGLLLAYGRSFLQFQAGTAMVVDGVMVLLFVGYLLVGGKPAGA